MANQPKPKKMFVVSTERPTPPEEEISIWAKRKPLSNPPFPVRGKALRPGVIQDFKSSTTRNKTHQ